MKKYLPGMLKAGLIGAVIGALALGAIAEDPATVFAAFDIAHALEEFAGYHQGFFHNAGVLLGIAVGALAGVMAYFVAGKDLWRDRWSGALGGSIAAATFTAALIYFGVITATVTWMAYRDEDPAQACEAPYYETLPPLQSPAGYVYLIRDEFYGLYHKLGSTTHPATHIDAELTTELPFDVEVVAIIETEDAARLLQALQTKFEWNRTRGDWYSLGDDDFRELCGA